MNSIEKNNYLIFREIRIEKGDGPLDNANFFLKVYRVDPEKKEVVHVKDEEEQHYAFIQALPEIMNPLSQQKIFLIPARDNN